MAWFTRGSAGKPSIPTVRFDPSRVTEAVRTDLRASLDEYEDLPVGKEQAIYDAALFSISRGGDLHSLCVMLIGMGVTKARAAQIARHFNFRASSIMAAEQQIKLGIKAKWLWSGACIVEGHQAANGKTYDPRSGLKVGGYRTYPGRDHGCSCVANSVIPGFD